MPGSKRHSPAVSLISLGLVFMCAAGRAEEVEDAPVSEAFLEFLADGEDRQGEWQDPMDYAGRQWQVLDQTTEKTEKTEKTDE